MKENFGRQIATPSPEYLPTPEAAELSEVASQAYRVTEQATVAHRPSLSPYINNIIKVLALSATLTGCDVVRGFREIDARIEQEQQKIQLLEPELTPALVQERADSLIAMARAEQLQLYIEPFLRERFATMADSVDCGRFYQALHEVGVPWHYLASADSIAIDDIEEEPEWLPNLLVMLTDSNAEYSNRVWGNSTFRWFSPTSDIGINKKLIGRRKPDSSEDAKIFLQLVVYHEFLHGLSSRDVGYANPFNDSGPVHESATHLLAKLALQQMYHKLPANLPDTSYSKSLPTMFIVREMVGANRFAEAYMNGTVNEPVGEVLDRIKQETKDWPGSILEQRVDWIMKQPLHGQVFEDAVSTRVLSTQDVRTALENNHNKAR